MKTDQKLDHIKREYTKILHKYRAKKYESDTLYAQLLKLNTKIKRLERWPVPELRLIIGGAE